MQRKIKMLSIMAVALFLCAGLFSQIARADILEEVFKRTAYVDLYQKKKDLEVRLRQETETGQKKLEEMREELERLKKEYETQELLLTEEAKKERQEEITAKVKQDQYTQEIIQDIINKIKQIAEREGYIYVFDKAALVYAAPIQDITGLIIDELNREYGAEKNE